MPVSLAAPIARPPMSLQTRRTDSARPESTRTVHSDDESHILKLHPQLATCPACFTPITTAASARKRNQDAEPVKSIPSGAPAAAHPCFAGRKPRILRRDHRQHTRHHIQISPPINAKPGPGASGLDSGAGHRLGSPSTAPLRWWPIGTLTSIANALRLPFCPIRIP